MRELFDKLEALVGSIPADKALHFIAGLLVAAIVAIIIPSISSFAFVVAYAVGLAKEVFDLVKYGNLDWRDLLATSLGGFVTQLFIWIS